MTLEPNCHDVETAQGVPITVTGVAQVKVMKEETMLGLASEQFLGKAVFEMEETILQTIEGHLRAILGMLTVEEIYADREAFAQQVFIFILLSKNLSIIFSIVKNLSILLLPTLLKNFLHTINPRKRPALE